MNDKINVGFVDDTSNIPIRDRVNKLLALPYGFYEFKDLGKYLIEFNNLTLISNHISVDEISKLQGFIQVEKPEIVSRFKIMIDNSILGDLNLDIIYAYEENNNIYLIDNELVSFSADKFENMSYIAEKDMYKTKGFPLTVSKGEPELLRQQFFKFFCYPHYLFYNSTIPEARDAKTFVGGNADFFFNNTPDKVAKYNKWVNEMDKGYKNKEKSELFGNITYRVMNSRDFRDGHTMIDCICNELR